MQIENDTGWCASAPYRDGSGSFITLGLVSHSRKTAQDKAAIFWNKSWKQLYRQGFRAIRVTLTPSVNEVQKDD